MKKLFGWLLILGLSAGALFADATTASRVRNFVNDKNSSIPITASYMDSEFDNVIGKLNAKVLAKSSAPSSPTSGDTWVDTSASPPIIKVYDGSNWMLASMSKGSDVASASSITLGTDGNFFDITGTTTITSITAKPAGFIAILQFDGVLQVTDGSNLKLQGNFTTAAESTLTLVSEGTNWFEISRQPSVYTPSASNALSGSVIQYQYAEVTSVVTCSTAIPFDNTKPQNTEGTQIVTVSITPNNASNILVIKAGASYGNAGAYNVAGAIFQDSTADALKSRMGSYATTNETGTVEVPHKMAAGTTSSTTFKLRVGPDSGTVYVNGNGSGTQLHNGAMAAYIEVWEIKA